MEAIINSKKLKEQVGALQGILARKNTIPVLSRIKIDALTSGDDPPVGLPTFADGARAAAICDAVLRSVDAKGWVTVDA